MPTPVTGAGVFPDVAILDFKTPDDKANARVGLEALKHIRLLNGGVFVIFEDPNLDSVEISDRQGDEFCWNYLMPLYYAHVLAREPQWGAATRQKKGGSDRDPLLSAAPSAAPLFVRHAQLAVVDFSSSDGARVFCVWDDNSRLWKVPGGSVDRSIDRKPLDAARREYEEETNPLGLADWKGPEEEEIMGRIDLRSPKNKNRQCVALFWSVARSGFAELVAKRQAGRAYCPVPLPRTYATRHSSKEDLRSVHGGTIRFVEHRFCAFVELSKLARRNTWAKRLKEESIVEKQVTSESEDAHN